jgi:hypothetical protein
MNLVGGIVLACVLAVVSYFLWPLVDWRSIIPINTVTGAPDDIFRSVDMQMGQFPKLQWKLHPKSNPGTRKLYANQPYFFKRSRISI